MNKFSFAKKTSSYLVSPATVDFMYAIDRDFHSIVTEKVSKLSKDAIDSQQDPDTMNPIEKKRIKKEILHCIIGNQVLNISLLGLLEKTGPILK